MSNQRARSVVGSSRDEVFALINDIQGLPSWHPVVEAIDADGDRWTVRSGFGDGELRIRAVRSPAYLAYDIELPGYKSTEQLFLNAAGASATNIVYTVSAPSGIGLIRSLLGVRIKNYARDGMSGIRSLLESENAGADARGRMLSMQEELEDAHRQIRNVNAVRRLLGAVAFIFLVFAAFLAYLDVLQGDPPYAASLSLIYGAVFAFLWLRVYPVDQRLELARLEAQMEHEDPSVEPVERRAQRLFRLHQAELDRYYVQARRQSSWAFAVCVTCVIVGFIIVAVAIVLIATRTLPNESAVTVAVLAAIGTILADFIAVIALRMYSGSNQALTQLHYRLVGTHHLHFANFLAAKIDDPKLRMQTLASIATKMSSGVPDTSSMNGTDGETTPEAKTASK